MVAQGTEHSWRPAGNSVPQVSVLGQVGSGDRVHPQHLLMIQNCEEWLIHKKAVLPFSKTWTGCGVGWRGADEVQRKQLQRHVPEERKLQPPVQDGAKLLRSSTVEKFLGIIQVNNLFMSQQCVLVVKKVKGILGCIGKTLPVGHRR